MTREPYEEIAKEFDGRMKQGREFNGLVPVKARVAKDVRAVFSVRLAPSELTEIAEIAKALGMKVGDFIRQAALEHARYEKAVKQGRLGKTEGQDTITEILIGQLKETRDALEKAELILGTHLSDLGK